MPGSKITRFEHFTALEEQGAEVDELDGPEFPDVIAHVYDWFLQLHASREGPISYQEIKAWSELTGNEITSFEVELIKRIDLEFLKQQADERSRKTPNRS